MNRIPLYQVDVFAERLFAGNPAAVCPLDEWLSDDVMQAIAAENNLSETAFLVKDRAEGSDYLLRWFTPTTEIELCGHATLAAGYLLLEEMKLPHSEIRFRTLTAGVLTVVRRHGALWLNLPARMPAPVKLVPGDLPRGLRSEPRQVLEAGNKFMALFDHAREVEALRPDFAILRRIPDCGIIVTAPGQNLDEDFVSRFFGPAIGIDEDPVTGSAHCLLVPYWAQRLGKTDLQAAQLSARGGKISCQLEGERVWLSGKVRPYLRGEICLMG